MAEAAPSIPHHIAIVMDGNGRWAKRRLMPRIAGHRQGVESLRRCIRACADVQDGRGRWRHRDAGAVALATDGSAASALACAAAAERLGAWLRVAHARALREMA